MNSWIKKQHAESLPRPKCCEKIISTPVVFFSAVTFEGEPENPHWMMLVSVLEKDRFDPHYRYTRQDIEVTHCPFCQTSLPEVELKPKPPKKVMTITDGGYYCDCCSERLIACQCYPSEARYRLKKPCK